MKQKISSFIFDRRLMAQFMLVNGVVISALTIIAVVFSAYFVINYNNMLNSQLSTILEISADSVQMTVNDVEKISLDFMISDEVQNRFNTILSDDKYTYEDYVEYNALKKSILDLVNDRSVVKYAVLLDDKYEPVISAMGKNPAWNDSMSRVIKENMQDNARYKWIAPEDRLSSLVAVRRVVDLSDPDLPNVGAIVIGINIDSIVRNESVLEGYPFHSLITAGDEILYTDFDDPEGAEQLMRKAAIEDTSKIEIMSGSVKYYKRYKALDIPGWGYMVYAAKRDILGSLPFIIDISIIIFIATVLLAFFLSYAAAKRMTKPLSELSRQMKKVESGIFEGVDINNPESENEIYSLAADFNVMIGQIDTLIHENYIKKILLQENELKLLQSQINPHFLYNTLESVHWMAKSGRTREISVMVQALSKLFRSAVNNKEFIITLREELDLLRNYVVIQRLRFENRLEINIDIDEEFYDYRLPKLILQPIVENSIKYALEQYQKACVISIYAKRSETGMRLYIADNGPGIERERLDRIRNNMPVESKSGIALKNIRRRMEMICHREDAMEIESEPGRGTTVILNIPKDI